MAYKEVEHDRYAAKVIRNRCPIANNIAVKATTCEGCSFGKKDTGRYKFRNLQKKGSRYSGSHHNETKYTTYYYESAQLTCKFNK